MKNEQPIKNVHHLFLIFIINILISNFSNEPNPGTQEPLILTVATETLPLRTDDQL